MPDGVMGTSRKGRRPGLISNAIYARDGQERSADSRYCNNRVLKKDTNAGKEQLNMHSNLP